MTEESAWDALAREAPTGVKGYLVRRLLPEAPIDVFAALTGPGNERALLVGVDTQSALARDVRLPETRGLEVRLATEKEFSGLAVVLVDDRFQELFDVLVDDLVRVAGRSADAEAAAHRVLTRLKRWQQFLGRVGQEGLSVQAQAGLYGELHALRGHLLAWMGSMAAIESWSGPEGAPHDFSAGPVALECKTTLQLRPAAFVIHGERQLDELGAEELYLVHLAVERQSGSGETLPDMVESIRRLLIEEPSAEEEFERLLMGTGYHAMHAYLYQGAGYVVLEDAVYRVGAEFPRLAQRDLPAGVHHVDYHIDRSACAGHETGWEIVQASVTGDRGER